MHDIDWWALPVVETFVLDREEGSRRQAKRCRHVEFVSKLQTCSRSEGYIEYCNICQIACARGGCDLPDVMRALICI